MSSVSSESPSRLAKRDGSIEAFDPAKIASAIERAGQAAGEFGHGRALWLTH